MDKKDDYDLLLQIAWEYFVAFWKSGGKEPEVAPIVKRIIARLPQTEIRKFHAESDSVTSRLGRKFRKERDVLLARVSSQIVWNRMDKLRDISDVVKRMRTLGISVRLETIEPRLFARDK